MRKLLLIASVVAGLSTCGQSDSFKSPTILATEVSNNRVRIISLHDTTTEVLVGVGAELELLAIVEPQDLSEAAASRVNQVPTLAHGPHSAEALLALRPTHIFGTEATLESQPGLDCTLEYAGIETHFIDPSGLDGLWNSITEIGFALDRHSQAEAWLSKLQKQVTELDQPSSLNEEEPIRVFFYDCCDPPFTAGARVPLTELLSKLGARNVFDDLDQDWTRVSWEAVLARKPELIVVHDYEFAGQGGFSDKCERLQQAPLGNNLPAVRNGHLIKLPLALVLEGPRTLEAIPVLRQAIEAARAGRLPASGSRAEQ